MIVSLKKFQEKYGLLDEAFRQWCALSKDNNSLLDGVGFGDFYKKLSREKYEEYRQNPNAFSIAEPGKMIVLPLTRAEALTLEELVANALCGYQDKSTEDTLMDLEIKFAGLHSESATEGMRL
ncbi:MAG: hypothetical protein IJH36_01655 [Clostridia bacterium]|nr:hypothetical protein [Clostridia bacterium]